MEASMKQLMSSSMFGLVPIPLVDTISSHAEVLPPAEKDGISRPMKDKLARIREELEAREGERKHGAPPSLVARTARRF
jgi:hypothetical protein